MVEKTGIEIEDLVYKIPNTESEIESEIEKINRKMKYKLSNIFPRLTNSDRFLLWESDCDSSMFNLDPNDFEVNQVEIVKRNNTISLELYSEPKILGRLESLIGVEFTYEEDGFNLVSSGVHNETSPMFDKFEDDPTQLKFMIFCDRITDILLEVGFLDGRRDMAFNYDELDKKDIPF